MPNFVRVITLGLAIAAVGTKPLSAQKHHQKPVPVKVGDPTIVLMAVDSLPEGAAAQIYLRANTAPVGIITVRSSISATELATAFEAFDKMWKRRKGQTKNDGVGSIVRQDVGPPKKAPKLSASASEIYEGYLEALATGRVREFPHIGKGRTLEIQMPDWK